MNDKVIDEIMNKHSENSGIPKDVLFGEPKECTMECYTHETKCRWGAYIRFLQERNKVLSKQASIMRKIELADFKQGLALGMAIPAIVHMIVRIFT